MTEAKRTQSQDRRHEPVSVNVRGLLLAVAGLIALVIAAVWGLWMLTGRVGRERPLTRTEIDLDLSEAEAPVVPHQRELRLKLDEEQRQQLRGYQWLDSERESARIPIERAMELTVDGYRSSTQEEQP